MLLRRPPTRILAVCLAAVVLLALSGHVFLLRSPSSPSLLAEKGLKSSAFNFTETKPGWLAKPVPGEHAPLVIRMAIISHPKEVERRATIRKSVLTGIPKSEVDLTYKFFVGTVSAPDDMEDGGEEARMDAAVREEQKKHGDIVVLDMQENLARMGEKRWRMLHWMVGSTDSSSYDFYMGADSDSFLRMAALSRRWRYLKPDTDPRKEQVIWGHHLGHNRHWTPSSEAKFAANLTLEDEWHEGPGYHYTVGIAYLFSSPVVTKLIAPNVVLPHHIPYPYDDVMLGSWASEFAPDAIELNDEPGFHDPPEHGWKTFPVDYETVCVHHTNVEEMQALRAMPEWDGEWEEVPRAWWEGWYPFA